MNADAEPHLLTSRAIVVLLFDGTLDRDGAFDGIDRAGEIGDHAVAGGIEDAAAIGGNQSIEDRPVGLQRAQGTDLVQPHQTAVFGDVGRKDCSELSFDYLGFCHRPSSWGADAGTYRSTVEYSNYSRLFDGGVVVPVHLAERDRSG